MLVSHEILNKLLIFIYAFAVDEFNLINLKEIFNKGKDKT